MVLGGTGFVGRHAAAALRARGHRVVIGTRHARRALAKLPAGLRDCDLRETHFESLTTRYVRQPLLADVDVVVNAVGILRERGGETYDRVHHMAPAALALACERAIAAIAATAADYRIVRPSLLDGEGGFGADWMRRVAKWPVHLYPSDARGRIAALDVHDLGDAIAVLCEISGQAMPREIELGGSARRTMAEYLGALRAVHDGRPALRVAVPAPLARLASHVCDLLHLSPLSGGLLELLRRDHLPRENLLQALIGRAPTPVGGRAPRLSGIRPSYAFTALPTGHETPVPPSPQ